MKALGMIEVYSFTTSVCTADICAKTADVKVIAFDRNRPFAPDAPAPLIMVVKIEGNVAAVRAAVEAGVDYAKSNGKYIVHHIIANPGEDVDIMAYKMDINKDKFNKKLPKSFLNAEEAYIPPQAIGLLEVQGLVASIEGLDSMVKAANVRIIHTEKRLGGRLVTIIVTGEISDVKAALAAGKANAEKLGTVYGCEAIPSLHGEVAKFFDFEA